MQDQAFEVLGIEPTADGRAIRAAFVRLARIYHPDRFVGMPDDVRNEAERRMKEVTVAYEQLRNQKRQLRVPASVTESELRERAEVYRLAAEQRRIEEEKNRARWRRWDEIERQAREKAEIDAAVAAMIRTSPDGSISHVWDAPAAAEDEPISGAPPQPVSLFEQRMEAIRRGETAPIARRSKSPA